MSDELFAPATGWVDFPQAVAEAVAAIGAVDLSDRAPVLVSAMAADDSPAFLWLAETKVLGRPSLPWDQNPVGSCVGHGATRAAQDLMFVEIAAGEAEEYPGSDFAQEVTYGGSRVEVGGGRIRGDGSVGAWAAQWLLRWGVVKRGSYGALDLTRYDPATCRRLGASGIPPDVEALAREHPVKDVALVKTADEVWAALGAGKPIFVCSDRGFSMSLDDAGYCRATGVWQHCMEDIGRFLHPSFGRSVVLRNSWGNYLAGTGSRTVRYVKADGSEGTFELPGGCFCTTLKTAADMAAQGDTFAVAGFAGWKKVPVPVDWTP